MHAYPPVSVIERAEIGSASADIRREVDYVLGHPRARFSPQNRVLLSFFAESDNLGGSSEYDIASVVLDRRSDFRPEDDAHVRIAVLRLRKALTVFYETLGVFRSFRLDIRKGGYRLVLVSNFQGETIVSSPRLEEPSFAWTISTPDAFAAQSFAFDLSRSLAWRLSRSPLVHDGALRAHRLTARSTVDALARARDTQIPVLAHLAIIDHATAVEIHVWHVTDRSVIWRRRIGAERGDHTADALARRIGTCLTDPLVGVLPAWLAKQCLRSRLAVAMRFFRFMATQDRALLPPALHELNEIDGTNFASPLTQALRLDAIRANYCFATGHQKELAIAYADNAARILESDPGQPYAQLAYRYMKMAVNDGLATEHDGTDSDDAQWSGSPSVDLNLYKVLSSASDIAGDPNRKCVSTPMHSFMNNVHEIIVAMRAGDFAAAEAHAFRPDMPSNFWSRTFQCSTALELGNIDLARHTYAKLLDEVPGMEDFAGRAITRMIPDKVVHERLLYHLAVLA